ncbi:thiopurine S-methyltransferase [Pendulispora rubella]|uniref:thiopurine S-methyltransferase n=1 Tax=Pendulispora rubella TaxID=2741070 RepID=A0ABZ2LFY7_9BACT
MDATFWTERWTTGKIAFHEGHANTYLTRHAERLGDGRRILVPLCGKAEDLAYLAGRGHHVVGVELVEDAARAFFAEHGATPKVTPRGPLTAYSAGTITVLVGDMFATTPELLGPIDTLYDRAALVALPHEMRVRYARHLRTLLPTGAPGLVVTIEYDQARMAGPPFAVLESELREHYRGLTVELLSEGPSVVTKLHDAGIEAKDRCFFVQY